MSSLAPRIILVTRQTELQHLLAQHSTKGQIEFFLKTRDQSIEPLQIRHDKQVQMLQKVRQYIPEEWSIANVKRRELDRFLFASNDVVIAVGQDGLVANLAKYLSGQPVIGISPDFGQNEGVLTAMPVKALPDILRMVFHNQASFQKRTMVEARLDDGQSLIALNEIFLGHKSHQSARYILEAQNDEEYQSSSGIIVSTGTGLTGWAKSIMMTMGEWTSIQPHDRQAIYFAREPWPSKSSGASLRSGMINADQSLQITSRMNSGGVLFADGIEQDFLHFNWGSKVKIGLAQPTLNLISGW